MKKRLVIIGGGAAGIFAAALCAEGSADLDVIVLEKTRQPLAKVKISGGGRCNVTHAEFDPKKLICNYPRGNPELIGPFSQFQPKDTLRWFEEHGVPLKTEKDGRLFPTTDHSGTITHCLLETARKGGARIQLENTVTAIEPLSEGYRISIEGKASIQCDFVLLATGGSSAGQELARALGHTLTPSVPSLFTFNTPSSFLLDLSGIAVEEALLSLPALHHKERGIVLLTHFGFSGPATLKLSAFAARDLHACGYKTELLVNWVPSQTPQEVAARLAALKKKKGARGLKSENPFNLPSNLWKRLVEKAGVSPNTPLSHTTDRSLRSLSELLGTSRFQIEGKTTHKAEFVTCGGIQLKEVDFKTLQSRLHPGLFFAGEILDIDGVTGGFNFQNAWTTAYLAVQSLCSLAKK